LILSVERRDPMTNAQSICDKWVEIYRLTACGPVSAFLPEIAGLVNPEPAVHES